MQIFQGFRCNLEYKFTLHPLKMFKDNLLYRKMFLGGEKI